MTPTQRLPDPIAQKVTLFFNDRLVVESLNLLKDAAIHIDYIREHPSGSYSIISGQVIEQKEYNINFKIKYGETTTFTSSCHCDQWKKESHCKHVSSLYLFHLLSKHEEAGLETVANLGPRGARPKEYGTLIENAYQMTNVAGNLDFHSCQYLLDDSKVVNYPLPTKFYGKIILNVIPILNEDNPYLVNMRYAWQDNEGEIHKNISLLRHTHLFNWKTGELLDLTGNILDALRTFKNKKGLLNIEEVLRIAGNADNISLKLQDEVLDFDKAQTPQPSIIIAQSPKATGVEVKLRFENEEGQVIPLPSIYKVLTFDNGYLQGFYKKNHAYHYLSSLISEYQDDESKTYVRLSKTREVLKFITEICKNDQKYYTLDFEQKKLVEYDVAFLKDFIKHSIAFFQNTFFRFSNFDHIRREITFSASASSVLSELSNYYNKMLIHNIKFYYQDMPVRKWSSKISFERVQSKMDWFDLKLNISEEDLSILKNLDPTGNFSVTDQGLVIIDHDKRDITQFIQKYIKTNDGHSAEENEDESKSIHIKLKRARIFELFELKKLGIEGALTDEEIAMCNRLLTLEKIPNYEISPTNKEIARNYQVDGYNWLNFLFENKLGACLADDMGLGKTLQTIMFLSSIYDKIEKVLIVCPVSILMNWKREFEKFSDIDVHVYYGGDRHLNTDSKIILTSYGVMKKEYQTSFKDMHFDILAFDEVQNLKNYKSLGAIAARHISASFRICLTGTPVENDLSEFYNIIDLCVPGIWGQAKTHTVGKSKEARAVARKISKPFILRRTKEQVLKDLPEKVEQHVFLQFTETEQEMYKANLTRIKQNLQEVKNQRKYGEILKGLLTLRQLCLWQKTGGLESTKINFLLTNLDQILAEGGQAIIFSQFTTYLDYIQEEFNKRHWKYSRIDGKQGPNKRQGQIELFQNGDTKLFLISLKAGGVGLNLTAAQYVFLMDPWWNPAVESQAIDRAHRIGQKNKLMVYRPIIKESVEEKVMLLQEQKQELFHDLLGDSNDEYFSGRLSMKDFEDILS